MKRAASPKEAREKGVRYYFTGKPCPRGHIGPRFASIRRCRKCCDEDKDLWEARHPERVKAYAAQHYVNNRQAYLERAKSQRFKND